MEQDNGYKKLQVYNLSHSLAVQIHEMSLGLPKFELYEEGSQIRRSAKSVACNIVEGYSLRKYKNEYLHYLYRAHGSSEETTEHLQILFQTKSLQDVSIYDRMLSDYKKLNGMLFNYIRFVEKEFESPAYLKDQSLDYGTLNPEP